MHTSNLEKYCAKAVQAGATNAKVIHPSTIVTAPRVRFKCIYGCPLNQRYSCPPHTPTPAERSAAGLKQHSIYVKGLRIEYLEGGKGDALVLLHVSGAKILEAIMPKAKAEVMDAVGHLPMIEKPEETAALYLSFLEQREPGLR